MSLLKDARTLRLDDLHLALAEALDVYEELAGHLEDATLSRLIDAQISRQKRVLEQVAERRRVLGDLPQAADPEHAQLEAIGARVRAQVLPGETALHYVESLIDESAEVARRLDDVLDPDLELDAEVRRLISELRDANGELLACLRARL